MPPRIIRGYTVLAVGILLFFVRPLVLPDALDGQPLLEASATRVYGCIAGADAASCNEVVVVFATAILMGLAIGFLRFRAMLIATAFSLPPLLIYVTLYPLWIVLLMLLLMPLMAHAALNAWLPEPSPAS